MADPADHAYAHTCAVLGTRFPAVEAAVTAVRRGGRVRWAVLGHARAAALDLAAESLEPDLDGHVPDDLTELAVALAATRPAVERAVVDLDSRHDLDRAAFARALGLPLGAASARAASVQLEWQQQLDPLVLARLGPGECDGLASVLGAGSESSAGAAPVVGDVDGADAYPADRPPSAVGDERPATLRALFQVGPAVADHAAGCALCSDRLRAMVSVRTLLAQRPIELAPPAVQAAVAPSLRRRPTLPPPLVPASPVRRWLRPTATVAAALLVALAGGAIVAARDGREGDDGQLEALTRVPAEGSTLTVEPASVEGTTPGPVTLSNHGDGALEWAAAADVPWLTVTPVDGTLEPGGTAELQLGVTPDAPEGDVRGAVRISAVDGSTAVVRLTTVVERPPELAAAAEGCDVAVTVEDEGEIDAVELHWLDGGTTRSATLLGDESGYAGRLAPTEGARTWWVTASDARGNHARTPDEHLAPGACT
jgi:hypothetical protein